MIIDEDAFLEHYGVKGMKWKFTTSESLDRIYRVAAGTESRRENIQKALRLSAKELAKRVAALKKEKKMEEDIPEKVSDLPDKKDDESIKDFLTRIGVTRLSDIDQAE